MKFYRYYADILPPLFVDVLAHTGQFWLFKWTRIYGVQVGPWFFGAIRGEARAPEEQNYVE